MTLKQQLFVQAYLANGGNATEAARTAGYKQPHSQGPRMLENVGIAEACGVKVAKVAMEADEVLALLTEQATATMEDFVSPTTVKHVSRDPAGNVTDEWEEEALRVDWKKAKRRGKLHLVSVFKYDKQGNPELRLYSAQAAAHLLGKYHGLFTDTIAIQDHLGEWAAGFAQDAAGVLREFITDDDLLAKALDALKSRLQARLDGGRAVGPGAVRSAAEVPDAA